MKTINTTDLPTAFLRALTMWVLRKLKVNSRDVMKVKYQNTTKATHGNIYQYPGRNFGEYEPIMHLGPTALTDDASAGPYATGRLYRTICILGQLCSIMPGTPRIPNGELGLYRQAIGKEFLEKAPHLIRAWQARVVERPKPSRQDVKLQQARKMVAVWKRKLRLAQTKYKGWSHRLARYEKEEDQ